MNDARKNSIILPSEKSGIHCAYLRGRSKYLGLGWLSRLYTEHKWERERTFPDMTILSHLKK